MVPSLEGIIQHTVDTKGRIVVPSRFRRDLVMRARGIILADSKYTLDRFGIWYEGVLQYQLEPSLDDAQFKALVNDATHPYEQKMSVIGEFPFEQLASKIMIYIQKNGSKPDITFMLYLEAVRQHKPSQEVLEMYDQGKCYVWEIDAQHRLLIDVALKTANVVCIGMGNHIAVLPTRDNAEE